MLMYNYHNAVMEKKDHLHASFPVRSLLWDEVVSTLPVAEAIELRQIIGNQLIEENEVSLP